MVMEDAERGITHTLVDVLWCIKNLTRLRAMWMTARIAATRRTVEQLL